MEKQRYKVYSDFLEKLDECRKDIERILNAEENEDYELVDTKLTHEPNYASSYPWCYMITLKLIENRDKNERNVN